MGNCRRTGHGPLLADCHMGEREFLKKELLERLGIYDSEIDPEGAFAWMTYREITDVIWNFLKEGTSGTVVGKAGVTGKSTE